MNEAAFEAVFENKMDTDNVLSDEEHMETFINPQEWSLDTPPPPHLYRQ